MRTCWLLRRRRAKVSRSLWMACVDVDEPSGRAFHSRTAGKDAGRRGIYAVWRMFAPDGDLMLVSMTAVDPDAGTPPLSWSDVGVNELVTTGTVTLLLADVQGSTRLWDTEPDQMATAVATLDATLAQLVAEFRGVRPLEQGEGDSFVIAFTRASDAIACALALQNAPLAPIRLRIGIHTGEVQLRDDANYIAPPSTAPPGYAIWPLRCAPTWPSPAKSVRKLSTTLAALAGAVEAHAEALTPSALETLGRLAVQTGSHREAVRLFGASDAVRRLTGDVRFPMYQAGRQAGVTAARDTLGQNDFEGAWTEGAALSPAEAIAYALRGRGPRRRPTSGWAALTPTERDVVRLAGEGLGNKEIGARLLISPRTVQTHLTHVYAKLGVSSRVALARATAGRG